MQKISWWISYQFLKWDKFSHGTLWPHITQQTLISTQSMICLVEWSAYSKYFLSWVLQRTGDQEVRSGWWFSGSSLCLNPWQRVSVASGCLDDLRSLFGTLYLKQQPYCHLFGTCCILSTLSPFYSLYSMTLGNYFYGGAHIGKHSNNTLIYRVNVKSRLPPTTVSKKTAAWDVSSVLPRVPVCSYVILAKPPWSERWYHHHFTSVSERSGCASKVTQHVKGHNLNPVFSGSNVRRKRGRGVPTWEESSQLSQCCGSFIQSLRKHLLGVTLCHVNDTHGAPALPKLMAGNTSHWQGIKQKSDEHS